MFTVISALLGFLGSGLPDLFKYFQDKQDKRHELDIMDKQIQMQAAGYQQRLEMIQIQADSAEMQSLYASTKTGVTWVDALGGSVRPILAFSFIFMFILTKLPIILIVLGDIHNMAYTDYLWTESDACIFTSIIAFYFGSRSFHKLRRS